MGARYIWGKYTKERRYYWDSKYWDNNFTYWVQESNTSNSYDVLLGVTNKPSLDRYTGRASHSGGTYKYISSTGYSIDSNDYPWAVYVTAKGPSYSGPTFGLIGTRDDTFSFDATKDDDDDRYIVFNRGYTNTDWKFTTDDGSGSKSGFNVGLYGSSSKSWFAFTTYKAEGSYFPDEFQQWLTSSDVSSYPNFGVSILDGYFYNSQEQDIIDPDSVSIPDLILYNTDISIEIVPSNAALNNKYGNITYTYSYKFNDTEWTDIKTISETTCSLHIPSDKQTVQVRVRVQDDIGFVSTTYVTSKEVPIYASMPPTAPASIMVDRAIAGWITNVAITSATDSDGTIVAYVFERKTNSESWTEIQNSILLTYSETMQGNWSTVQYRAKAIDDRGTSGPYVESDVYEVKNNVIVIVGPKIPDFGTKIGKFEIVFYVIVAGSQSNDISVSLFLDATEVYTGVVNAEQRISVEIDTSKLEKKGHTVTITASKEGYEMASEDYTFEVSDLTLPKEGMVVRFQDSTGKTLSPMAKAFGVFMEDGRDLETVINDILSRLS